MLALGVAAGLRQLIRLGSIDPSLGGEKEDPVVRRGDEEVLNHIVLTQRRSLDATTTTPLGTIEI